VRRFAIVVLAYAVCVAVFTGALTASLAVNALLKDQGVGVSMIEIMFGFGLPIFLVLGLPVALPLVALTEVQRSFGSGWERRWQTYAFAGSLCGIVPFLITGASSWEFLNLATLPAALAGLVYWLVAWRWFTPEYARGEAIKGGYAR